MAGILVTDGWMKELLEGRTFVASAFGNGSGDEQDVADAIDWCVNNDADIISLSLGGTCLLPVLGSNRGWMSFIDAIEQGIIVIAAAE